MLDYTMRIDFSGGRWFQVKLVDVGNEKHLEFKTEPNTLVVSLPEREKILSAVQTAIEAVARYQGGL